VSELRDELAQKIRAAAQAHLTRGGVRTAPRASDLAVAAHRHRTGDAAIIGIGASTGGVEALRSVLVELPAEMPPIVIVQHIPAVFSAEFARRLDKICRIRVKEAADGDPLVPGLALIAPGNFHLTVRKLGGQLGGSYRAVVCDGAPVQYQRPSVDVLFESLAREAGREALGVILTGMGADGAAGLLAMKQAGARTIAQNEASCVVFGMPREAIQLGAVDEILPLDQIAAGVVRLAQIPPVQIPKKTAERVDQYN
jgi:two-component system chemotaxis response regulator CheB